MYKALGTYFRMHGTAQRAVLQGGVQASDALLVAWRRVVVFPVRMCWLSVVVWQIRAGSRHVRLLFSTTKPEMQ